MHPGKVPALPDVPEMPEEPGGLSVTLRNLSHPGTCRTRLRSRVYKGLQLEES